MELDNIVHIDTDENGGILAGSNPRSVLFAVYRFLRGNSCRWLYPGIDGEHVPMKPVEPVKYHKLVDHRFRGFAGEGSESQTCVLECIDYYTKPDMNMEGEKSKDENISPYFDPERTTQLESIFSLCAHEKNLAEQHLNMPTRPQTVSWRLLLRHAEYCELWAAILKEKSIGNNKRATQLAAEFRKIFGRHELEIERYCDHGLACTVLGHVTRKTEKIIID